MFCPADFATSSCSCYPSLMLESYPNLRGTVTFEVVMLSCFVMIEVFWRTLGRVLPLLVLRER